MNHARRIWAAAGLTLILVGAVACSGAGSDALLGPGEPGVGGTAAAMYGMDPTDLVEGINLAADPATIELDPCDPEAPTEPGSEKLLGKTSIGAVVLDDQLEPVAGVEIVFSTSAGELESAGQPVTTDEQGLATDVLAVTEDDAGDVVVTATSNDLSNELTIPVELLPVPPITLEMDPAYLWPPNHKMRDVTAVFGGLDCASAPSIELVSVESNEPDNGGGDGNTEGDIEGAEIGTADTEFRLRAERAGGGDGRVYTVVYRLVDDASETSMLTSEVRVPHDQGH